MTINFLQFRSRPVKPRQRENLRLVKNVRANFGSDRTVNGCALRTLPIQTQAEQAGDAAAKAASADFFS
jgi:hypothetical protein